MEGVEAVVTGDVGEQKHREKRGFHAGRRVREDGAEDHPVDLATDAREPEASEILLLRFPLH